MNCIANIIVFITLSLLGASQSTSVNELELPKQDYAPGVLTTVSAEIQAPNGAESREQTIDVYTNVVDDTIERKRGRSSL